VMGTMTSCSGLGVVDVYVYETIRCSTGHNANVDRMLIEIDIDIVVRNLKVWPSFVDWLFGFVLNRYWGEPVIDVIRDEFLKINITSRHCILLL
jgi:hypothetical protein